MAQKKPPHRHYLLCPVCLKTQESLSCHLRRVCKKNSNPADIEAVVERAKQDVLDLLQNGRAFSYAVLAQIMAGPNPLKRLIEELERRHLIVTGAPPPLPTDNAAGGPSTSQPPETEAGDQGEPSGECEPSDMASVSSGELFQRDRDVTYSNEVRQSMSQKGLYEKHNVGHPLLDGFAQYLKTELLNKRFKQEVENVARFLHFADPKTPSLQFVKDRDKLRGYLRALSEAKLKKQTQQTYLKSLKRFLNYHTVYTNLRTTDMALHAECMGCIEYIGSLQKSNCKLVGKEITQKRYKMLMGGDQLTPKECLAVLDAAKNDFVDVMEKLTDKSSDPLEPDQSPELQFIY